MDVEAGSTASLSARPRGAVMQEQIQAGEHWKQVSGEVGKSSAKGNLWVRQGRQRRQRQPAFFLAGVSNVAKRDTRKQDCTKVGATDDDIPISDAPTHHAESVWGTLAKWTWMAAGR